MVEKVFPFLMEYIELSFYIRACKELSETIKLDHRFAENCPEKKYNSTSKYIISGALHWIIIFKKKLWVRQPSTKKDILP